MEYHIWKVKRGIILGKNVNGIPKMLMNVHQL